MPFPSFDVFPSMRHFIPLSLVSLSFLLLMCSNTLATFLNDSQVSCSLSGFTKPLSSTSRPPGRSTPVRAPPCRKNWSRRSMIWKHSSCCRPATKRGLQVRSVSYEAGARRVSSDKPVMERGRVCAHASPTLSSRVVISRCRPGIFCFRPRRWPAFWPSRRSSGGQGPQNFVSARLGGGGERQKWRCGRGARRGRWVGAGQSGRGRRQ
ncbi:hypothetical protein F5148DRAFT_472223 [Russula earlei]|uniref:Uncharacterized protein n=1 Tax=Russula earlei TaxID=71964 RepID=A0ACC0UI20_9AGAM|nr:hypothetical protein F5148DRAFT_472223 [Russula earlei]